MSSTRGHFPLPAPNPFGPEMSKEAERDLNDGLEEHRREEASRPERRPWWRRLLGHR